MMTSFNLNNKQFRLVDNADHGAVNEQTAFHYHQEDHIVTAHYQGGGVRVGHILATFISPDQLDMRYHCIMDDDSLKVGKAIAQVVQNEQGLIALHLDWEWLGGNEEKGKSIYLEVD